MISDTIRKAESLISAMPTWGRYISAFLLGASTAAAMPPLGMFFMLPVTISLFILLARNCDSRKESFLTGWAFGSGYFICGFYWISYALFVDIQLWWWVLPLSLIVGPTLFALYYGFIPLLAHRYNEDHTIHALAMCALMAATEWLRGHAFTGFPWNLTGYTWFKFLPVMQTTAFIGIYGLTLFTILWAAMPVMRSFKIKAGLIILFFVILFGGLYRIHSLKPSNYQDVAVRIVQPNIKQTDKWEPEQRYTNLRKLLMLSRSDNTQNLPIKFVIWPETATILNLDASDDMLEITASALPVDSVGVLGSLIAKDSPNGKDTDFFNSVSLVSSTRKILGIYNKHHLVPFGEYIPYRKYINLTPIAAGISSIGDFKRGDGLHSFNIGNGLPKPSPLVCYEVIFPSRVALGGNARPDWLVNVTNDAWYGTSAGPYQHFEIAKTRAIEEGLPLVRAANTGISGVIDPLGRVIISKELNGEGVIDALLPRPLSATLYSKVGDSIFFALLVMLMITVEVAYRRKNVN